MQAPTVSTSIDHQAQLPLKLGIQKNNDETGEALGEQPLWRESPHHHPRGNVASLALERLPPTRVNGRGTCGGIDEAEEADWAEGKASREWEVAEKVQHECKRGSTAPGHRRKCSRTSTDAHGNPNASGHLTTCRWPANWYGTWTVG